MIQQIRLLLIGALFGMHAQAQPLLWSSDAGQTNFDSSGNAMDAGFLFELGSFSVGFQPSSGNVEEWAGHWVAADSTSYNTTDKRFNRLYEVTGNPAPFTVGGEAWVMGTRVDVTGTERILFRKTDWKWPAPNPLAPIPLQWNAKLADQVVLGTVDADGSPFLMQTVRTQSYAQWQMVELMGEDEDGVGEDADQDGAANELEFALGTSPTDAGEAPEILMEIVEVDGMDYLQVRVPRRIDREAMVVVEVSGNLTDWDSGPGFTTVVSEAADLLLVRDLTSKAESGGRRFARVRVSLPGM